PQEDAARLVLQLRGEGTVAAVEAERGGGIATQVDGRGRADNLPLADPVVLVEVDLRLVRAGAAGGEGEGQFGLRGRAVRLLAVRRETQGERNQREGEKALHGRSPARPRGANPQAALRGVPPPAGRRARTAACGRRWCRSPAGGTAWPRTPAG